MIRCSRCVMPANRPDGRVDANGVCGACRAFERRDDRSRPGDLIALIHERGGGHPAYDCVIGSSGGKDSTYITLKALGLGLRPLVVTATTDILTEIGRRNILNVRELGVDCIEFSPNPVLRRKIMRIALAEVGDIEWGEHATIFGLPLRIARDMRIGIVLYGENPQDEYSFGSEQAQSAVMLDRAWRERYGGLLGLRPADFVGRDGITPRDMWPYEWPPDTAVPVFGVWLGQFIPWDGWRNAVVARDHGFEIWPTAVSGNGVGYESLDNAAVGIHDRFKFLKFGFGRATDIASLHIRRRRFTREEGMGLVRRHDGVVPWSYLGWDLADVLSYVGLSLEEYFTIEDRFANKQILVRCDDPNRRWVLREDDETAVAV